MARSEEIGKRRYEEMRLGQRRGKRGREELTVRKEDEEVWK